MAHTQPGPIDGLYAPAPQVRVLHPGDVACGERGDRLETLLGSCVAIVLTDPRRTVAVMCHVVHSRLPASGQQDHNTAYGEAALAEMAQRLLARGIAPALCDAFLVGGGNMFPALVTDAHVGEHNVRWALAALARTKVRLVLQDTGGATYRRIGWTVGAGLPDIAAVPV
jgi:chemotaxis protein CheD